MMHHIAKLIMIYLASSSIALGDPADEPPPTFPWPVEVVNDPLDVNVNNSSLVVTPSANRQPFQIKRNVFFNTIGNGSAEECFSASSDQWLKIEHLSALGNSAKNFMNLNVETNAIPGPPFGTGFTHVFALENVFTLPSSINRFQLSVNTTMYSAPGSYVCLRLVRGVTAGVIGEGVQISIDGMLTDQP